MATLNEIQQFLAPKKMAVVGASRNVKKFGGAIVKELLEKGFDLYPVNPNADEIQGVKCYKSVTDLPEHVKHIYIVTPKKETMEITTEVLKRNFEMIWIQQKSETPEVVKTISETGIPFIYKKCIFMFADPVKSIHSFHRSLVKLFGGYPKMVVPSVN